MSPLWSFLLTLAYCLPVLALVVPLLARRYVGERALERRIRVGAVRRPTPAPPATPRPATGSSGSGAPAAPRCWPPRWPGGRRRVL